MTSVVNLIRHYQRDIEKCSENEARVLRCLSKLHQLGVTVQHLQDTGVGRTVNALRKEPGEVGIAARALVAKWKHMVASAEQSSEEDDNAQHSGRDSAEDSDQNASRSRDVGQEYVSDHETGEFNVKFSNETHGNYDPSTKRYHDSEEDESRKRTKYDQDTGDESELEETNNQVKIEQEDEIGEHDENIDNGYPSDSTVDDEKHLTIKDEPKYEEKKQRHKSSKHSRDDREHHKHAISKHEHSSKHKSESRHRSEKDSKKHSSVEDKERRKDKEPRYTSESKSSKRSEKNENTPDKNRSIDKHSKTEDKSHKSFDRHKPIEKSDRSSSKDKNSSSSNKHKSSKSADESNHKEKSRERASSSNRKESSKEHSKSSIHKEKFDKREIAQNNVEHGNKENKVIEKQQNGEYSSKTKHTDRSSSHSHKNRTEKSSNSDFKNQSSERLNLERKSEKFSSSSKHKSSSSHKTSNNKSEMPKKKISTDNIDSDDGIGCESGASFAEALGMVSPVKSKKKRDVDLTSPSNNSSTASTSNGGFTVPASLLAPSTKLEPLQPLEISALPEISPNYKPRPPPRLLPQVNEEEALNYVMSTKNQRTKVFSGNKTYGKVLSLYELCVNVLQEHIDALEYTGGVPYEILKPVVDRANPDQLFALEHYNPYLMEDTNDLWKQHCEKKFRNKKRHEWETWRDMYLRCLEEQEAKLKSLTANIKMSQDARNAPTKQTKMAYVDTMVKPPRNIARKQAIHGTARAAVTSPAARVAALAGAGVVKAGTLPPRPSPLAHAPSSSSSAAFKPKKAPLMQKALQLMRGRKR